MNYAFKDYRVDELDDCEIFAIAIGKLHAFAIYCKWSINLTTIKTKHMPVDIVHDTLKSYSILISHLNSINHLKKKDLHEASIVEMLFVIWNAKKFTSKTQ